MADQIEVNKEIGWWVVRVNGVFIDEFWREDRARRVAMQLMKALRAKGGDNG